MIRTLQPERKQEASGKRKAKKKPTADKSSKTSPQPHNSPLYNNLVPAYHALWSAVAKKRIDLAVESLEIEPGAKVLEVGVGSGCSLASYPRDISLTGVDLSESMLAEAQHRIDQRGWDHITVMPMNAEQLEFEDSSFDLVTTFHTISVVSRPQQMMREIIRRCKPGGRILIVNHFRSHKPLIARMVDSAGNITKRLGWRTDLDLDEVLGELPIRLDTIYKPSPLSLFTIMKATCKPDEVAIRTAVKEPFVVPPSGGICS
jgi:phosphatidylethanolamine/phosphatidyl-N-methylethanolamine N-methyltransferase